MLGIGVASFPADIRGVEGNRRSRTGGGPRGLGEMVEELEMGLRVAPEGVEGVFAKGVGAA